MLRCFLISGSKKFVRNSNFRNRFKKSQFDLIFQRTVIDSKYQILNKPERFLEKPQNTIFNRFSFSKSNFAVFRKIVPVFWVLVFITDFGSFKNSKSKLFFLKINLFFGKPESELPTFRKKIEEPVIFSKSQQSKNFF